MANEHRRGIILSLALRPRSIDKARGFQPTPQDYQFGVCAVASSDPHCTVSSGSVPTLIDVITPAGVIQSDETDR